MAGNPLANVLGKVNASNALVVTLDGGTASATLFLAGDGTAAAPSYSFANDTDVGLHLIASNRLGFDAGGGINFELNGGTTALILTAAGALQWGSSGTSTPDVSLSRGAANRADWASGDSQRMVLGTVQYANANGQLFDAVQQLTELTTVAAAATTDTTIQMPANAVVLGVSVRVTVIIPTAATFTVGDSGSAARFSTAAVAVAAGSTDPGTKAGAYYNASALSIRLTPNLTPADNSGRVRVTIYYYTVTPPTS